MLSKIRLAPVLLIDPSVKLLLQETQGFAGDFGFYGV
jgi:hypothetical protein